MINVIAGALGGAGAGKGSSQFDLGMIGNVLAARSGAGDEKTTMSHGLGCVSGLA
jgi:hypothetical protein